MGFWKSILNQTERVPTIQKKSWKTGMWVQTQQNKTGILVFIGSPCIVHLVDRATGNTIEEIAVPIEELRQSIWTEIPECRQGITKEEAEALGYGA